MNIPFFRRGGRKEAPMLIAPSLPRVPGISRDDATVAYLAADIDRVPDEAIATELTSIYGEGDLNLVADLRREILEARHPELKQDRGGRNQNQG